MEYEHVVGDSDRGSRKKKRNLTQKERKKQIRYSDSDPNLELFDYLCKHESCKSISLEDLRVSRAKIYRHPDKIKQDTKLSHLIEVSLPKRSRCRKVDSVRPHSLVLKYKMWINSGTKKQDVCQKMFLSVFNVSQRRVQNIGKSMKGGCGIMENRGGDRRSHKNLGRRQKVKEFIAKLRGRESHYGRAKSRRFYLSSEWNIKKLSDMYNSTVPKDLQVNYKFFSRIFNSDFNIGFGSPATDVCGFCTRHQGQIQLCKNPEEKTKLMTNLRVHRLRAKQFYTLMKEKKECRLSYCFDLQQVQVLPKVPIGDAFYAQQLSFYAFCVTNISSRSPTFYTWLESQAGRGSIEVGSALLDFLSKIQIPDHKTELALFCDGCGGQNKNSHIVHMLMIWLQNFGPPTLKTIILCFPVRGHSFLPADRIFGRIEKLLRVHSTIKCPDKYWEIYSQVGVVRKLGLDWKVYDIKSALNTLKKLTAISEAKRIIFKRTVSGGVCVKLEQFYRNDDLRANYQTLLKKGKKINQITLSEVPLTREVKEKKLKSLHKLLVELATENWRNDPELTWLSPILSENIQELPNNHADDSDTDEDDLLAECNCQEDDGGIKI